MSFSLRNLLSLTLTLISTSYTTTGSPVPELNELLNVTSQFNALAGPGCSSAEKTLLRVMPLGASMTEGYLSTPAYGYRKPLRDWLRCNVCNTRQVSCA